MNTAADGFALDFGVQYRFDRNLSIGTTVKNIGSNMEFSGEDLKIKTEVPNSGIGTGNGVYEGDTEAFNIPSYFELSGAYILDINEQNNIDIAAAFRSNNSFEDEFVLGLEYDYSDMFFMRGGYNFLLEHSKESIYDFSLGAGLKYQTAEGISFVFDYAYRNVKDFPTQNHVFTIKLGIE
jgi:long-subunit fatty acid transport protein